MTPLQKGQKRLPLCKEVVNCLNSHHDNYDDDDC